MFSLLSFANLFQSPPIHVACGSVDELAAKPDVQEEIDNRQRTLIGIGNRVGTLAEKMTWNEVKHSKLEDDLKKKADKQDIAIEEIKSTTGSQSETIRELFQHMRVLESVVLQVSDSCQLLMTCC